MLLAVLDVETVKQLTVDGFFRGCSYGLLGAGFALILSVTGRFHFAYAFTYTFAVYMAYQFTFPWGVPFWPSAILGVLVSAIVGVLIERIVYRPLAANAAGGKGLERSPGGEYWFVTGLGAQKGKGRQQ